MERYQDNLKDKTIDYQGRILYIVDQIEYNGDYYVYAFNAEKYEKDEKLEISILKKVNNGELEVVEDMILFDKILGIFGMNVLAREIKKLQQ